MSMFGYFATADSRLGISHMCLSNPRVYSLQLLPIVWGYSADTLWTRSADRCKLNIWQYVLTRVGETNLSKLSDRLKGYLCIDFKAIISSKIFNFTVVMWIPSPKLCQNPKTCVNELYLGAFVPISSGLPEIGLPQSLGPGPLGHLGFQQKRYHKNPNSNHWCTAGLA